MDSLVRSYDNGSCYALRGVDMAVASGEFIAILGPSGCGKTTLLQIMGTIDEPTSGTLSIGGRRVDAAFDRRAYRASSVGFVFQAFHLLPTFTAIENVQIPMLEMPWTARARLERARELLSMVSLDHRAGHLPSQLSGGERQRVAIARSLANRPSVLLADEPTGNLDSENAAKVMQLLDLIHREHGMTILLVTHNAAVAGHALRKIHMRDGRIYSSSASGVPSSDDPLSA